MKTFHHSEKLLEVQDEKVDTRRISTNEMAKPQFQRENWLTQRTAKSLQRDPEEQSSTQIGINWPRGNTMCPKVNWEEVGQRYPVNFLLLPSWEN